jgi:hypothetical protein
VGASGEPFTSLVEPNFRAGEGSITFGAGSPGETTISNNDYATNGANNNLADAQPRMISNLIVDQTLNNPAAIITALMRAGVEGVNIMAAQGEISAAFAAVRTDLPPEAPSFITRVCGLEFHILRRQFGQARRARSPQIAQALDALLPVFGSQAMSAA